MGRNNCVVLIKGDVGQTGVLNDGIINSYQSGNLKSHKCNNGMIIIEIIRDVHKVDVVNCLEFYNIEKEIKLSANFILDNLNHANYMSYKSIAQGILQRMN